MKEFDGIRIVDKDESVSFEMTGNVAEDPQTAIMLLFRATSGLIATVAKDGADPQEVAEACAKAVARHIGQGSQDERDRRAEDGKEGGRA